MRAKEKWIKARATIIESPDAPEGATRPTFLHTADEHQYVIDIAAPDGQFHRTTVSMFSRFVHEVGAPLFVEFNTKTGETKVDFHAMSQLAQSQLASNRLVGGESPGQHTRGGPPAGQGPTRQPAFSSPSAPRLAPSGSPMAPTPEGAVGRAFDTSGGKGTAEQRLARLQQLLDKGILTESEYAAKRQEIISEL